MARSGSRSAASSCSGGRDSLMPGKLGMVRSSVLALALLAGACVHNPVEWVPTKPILALSHSRAYLLVATGGVPEDQAGVPVTGFSDDGRNAYLMFNELDGNAERRIPGCYPSVWAHGMIAMPMNGAEHHYNLISMPDGYYGFSDDRYLYLKEGKITYLGDYYWVESQQSCQSSGRSAGCGRVERADNYPRALSWASQMGIPKENMERSMATPKKNLVGLVFCGF